MVSICIHIKIPSNLISCESKSNDAIAAFAKLESSSLEFHLRLKCKIWHLTNLEWLQDIFFLCFIQARVHLGHNSGLRHPSMSPYIFGARQDCDIIDLEQTLPLLHQALNVTGHIVYRGGMVLFLSRQMQVLPWVERLAREVGEFSHCRAWQRGQCIWCYQICCCQMKGGNWPLYY